MGFLDNKDRIMDIQLTYRGRELLSMGQLDVTYYAFSDDFIDYSGSLNLSLQKSASLDDIVYRNYVAIEATQMDGTGLQQDLRSFLYTAPEQRKALPVFRADVPLSMSLVRTYKEKNVVDFFNQDLNAKVNFDFVISTQQDDASPSDRQDQYLAEQNLKMIEKEDPGLINVGFKTS